MAVTHDLEPEPAEPEMDGDGATRQPLPGEPLYTVKVDGQERQVPLSEITASYQMQAAAQNRLNQANVVLGRVRGMEQAAAARAAAPAAPADTPEEPAAGESGDIDYTNLVEKLHYADTPEAAVAFKATVEKIVAGGGGSPDAAAVTAAQVEARVLERVEWSTALTRFGEDYQDILQDPKVTGIAGSMGRALYQQAIQEAHTNGTPRPPYYDIFKEAGDRTREWRNGLIRQQAGNSETPLMGTPAISLSSGRSARKRAAVQPPTPRSGVAREAARWDKAPKSDEQRQREGIREIQRGRGQL